MQRPTAPSPDRLYIVTRRDLPVGLAAAQAVHAAFQFASEHPDLVGPWLRDSQYLVIVTAPDEESMYDLARRAYVAGIEACPWHEPDRDNEFTALALQPGDEARRLCSSLPLLGKQLEAVA